MSWIDEFLTSSAIVWIIILIGILHLYLKKTGKTFVEFIRDIRDAVTGLTEEEVENVGPTGTK